MAATRRRCGKRGPISTERAKASPSPAQVALSTSTVAGAGSSPITPRTFAPTVELSSTATRLARSAVEPGSRAAAVALLAGIAETLAIEADQADDYDVTERLTWLLVDVFDAKEALV